MLIPAKPVPGKPIPASWGSTLVDYLRSITPRSSATVRVRTGAGGTTFEARPAGGVGGTAFPWDKLAFGYALSVNDERQHICTIHPGAVRLHGIGKLSLDEDAEVTLTGDPEWVFVEYARSTAVGGAVTIGHRVTEPESTSATVRVPLYRFDARADGGYTLGMICHLGDVQFDSPIR